MPKKHRKKPLKQLIREFRDDLNLSQEEFGRFVSADGDDPFSQETVSYWESGKREPTVKTLRMMLLRAKEKHIKLNADDLLTDPDIAS